MAHDLEIVIKFIVIDNYKAKRFKITFSRQTDRKLETWIGEMRHFNLDADIL